MKAKNITSRILKIIQILFDLMMAAAGYVISCEGLNNSTYFYSDCWTHILYVLIGIVIFNGLVEYVKKLIKDF